MAKENNAQETTIIKAAPKKADGQKDEQPRGTVKAASMAQVRTLGANKHPQTRQAQPDRPQARPPIGKPVANKELENRSRPPIGKPMAKPMGKPMAKADVPQTEVPKTETPAAEAPKAETPKVEVPVTEVPKTEAPKTETPAAAPKAEAPKAETPAAAPKAEAQKPTREKRAPRAESGRENSGRDNSGRNSDRKSEGRNFRDRNDRDGRPSEGGRSPRDRNDRNDRGGQGGAGRNDRGGRGGDRPALSKMETKPNQKNTEKRDHQEKERNKFAKLENGGSQGKKNKERMQQRSLEKQAKPKKHNKPKPVVEEEEDILEELQAGTVAVTAPITVAGFCEQVGVSTSTVIMALMKMGIMANINQNIDEDTIMILADDLGISVVVSKVEEEEEEEGLELFEDKEEDLKPRAPIITVMGHVDHGKTSLLDAIRKTNVTASESGGITQHIGASEVMINGQKIVFLDTPGHEAFTAMRARGAHITDIAVLVVAADDGVMPQTIESISHAKAAGVPVIVAINKIDKPSANIEKVKQELIEYELVPEDWGGSTIFVPVSAHTKEGIKELLEMILLTAEVKELKANPNRNARGLVIEAELDKGKGPVATVLVQKGTLHVGDPIAAGACYGRVRAMMDDKGRRVKEAGPSTPVEILGLNDVPNAGEVFVQPENEKEARSFAETFISESKNKLIEDTKMKLSLDDLFSQIKAGNVKELPLIIKADVQGSVEAVKQSLTKLSNEEVVVKVIHGGVGAINESDVSLASASNAIIIGFNVRPDATAKSIAEREKVDVRLYKVIYQAIEDVEAAMKGMLDPVFEEKVIGHAVIRQLFKASGVGTIAGSYVLDGKFQRGCSCRITREGEQIYDGPLASLKRFKDDVKEVAAGYECGLVFEKFNDLQEDDQIEAYMMVEVPR